jgi:hypothetical protein
VAVERLEVSPHRALLRLGNGAAVGVDLLDAEPTVCIGMDEVNR